MGGSPLLLGLIIFNLSEVLLHSFVRPSAEIKLGVRITIFETPREYSRAAEVLLTLTVFRIS